jgi:DNA-binding NarL/FixJ family response regulator
MAIRILLADKHEVIRRGVRHLLALEPDLEVVGEAEDGRETLKQVQDLRPEVVIMDISMVDMTGAEATRRILELDPSVKVIAFSIHSDSLFVLNMLNSGAAGFLLKDCALEELVHAIRAVVNQRTYLSPGVSDSGWLFKVSGPEMK